MSARIAFFFAFFLTTAALQAAPDIQHWQTGNGARVYFVPAPELPMVDIHVVFDAGSARDGDKAGLALMTNGMLAEGAGKWSSDDIAERFEGVGAAFGNESQRDMASVTLRSLTDAELLEPSLETLATVLARPTFPKDVLARERRRLLVALQQQKQSPDTIADQAFYKAIYGNHPYASDPLGTEQSVKNIGRNDLAEFHRRYYVGNNAVVAIVGALDRKQAEALAEKVVGGLPAGKRAPELPPVNELQRAEEIKIDFPSSQTHIQLGQPGVSRGDPDYYPLYLGNHILGGSGLVSRLSDEIREKRGLSYSTYSYFRPMERRGPFIAGLQTRNDQAGEALKVMHDTVETFTEKGPTKEELAAAKKNITGGFALRIASNSKIVGYLAMIGFYDLPLDYLDTFIPKMEAITLAQVRDAFERRIHPNKMATVIVGGEK